MKSLFSRLRGQPTPPPTRPSSSASGGKENASGPTGNRKRPVSLRQTSDPSNTPAPLRSPTPLSHDQPGPSRPQSTDFHLRLPSQDVDALGTMWESEETRVRRNSGEGGKKVTFRSPAPTPALSTSILDSSAPVPRSPDKMNSRLIEEQRPNPPSRASTAQSYSSRRSLSMRKTSTPYGQPFAPSPTKSLLLSPAESDGSQSTRSYLPPPNSWSEMAEEELIANLGPRERTRQEVLFEIVSSEERFVLDIVSALIVDTCLNCTSWSRHSVKPYCPLLLSPLP